MIRQLRAVVSLGIILTAANLGVQAQKYKPMDAIYVGVLDDAREELANFEPRISEHRVVRPLFEKNAKGWSEVNASFLPNHTTWTVAFDGKNLGKVETQTSPDGFTPIQRILSPRSAIPTVGTPSQQFAGLLGDGTQTKFRRPLIVISKPYFQDPDGWKRIKLPDEVALLVRAAFRVTTRTSTVAKTRRSQNEIGNFPTQR